MAFSTRRGRPPKTRPLVDKGTSELQQKRKHHHTTEPLDLCLYYHIINDEEHKALLHFRWLYSLRFGIQHPHCALNVDIAQQYPMEDPVWRQRK